MRTRIVAIVEGYGEVSSVPILIRRIATLLYPDRAVECDRPIRMPRDQIARNNHELSRRLELASSRAGDEGAILILFDGDEECVKQLLESITGMDCVKDCNVPLSVVIAKRCFETWLLQSATSLRGKRGLNNSLEQPADPESVSNPKKWLEKNHQNNTGVAKRWVYSERADQPALCAEFDIDLARGNRSFDKLFREVERLLNA